MTNAKNLRSQSQDLRLDKAQLRNAIGTFFDCVKYDKFNYKDFKRSLDSEIQKHDNQDDERHRAHDEFMR
jgi:hypothetical protein